MPRLLAAAALLVALTGCGQPSPSEAAADLEALFPTLAEYHVTNLYRTDECEYIAYERGAFVTDPGSSACEIDVDGPSPRMPFDDQARTDLDAIYRESERHGPKLQSAFPDYGPAGSIDGGIFGFRACTDYVYDPAWSELPRYDSEDVAAVDSDWYRIDALC